MQNEAPEEFLRRFLSCSRLLTPGGGRLGGSGTRPYRQCHSIQDLEKSLPCERGPKGLFRRSGFLTLVSITTKSGTFQPPNRGVWRLFDPIRNPRIEQMFFVRKSAGFRRNRGIFFGEKAKKTIAILLQTIYTKKESGAKWRESPP